MYVQYPNNRAWSFYVQRLIDESVHGAADFNECYRTLSRIPENDREAWYIEWLRLAGQIEGLARDAARAGHAVSARDAFYRAFTYFRTAQFYLTQDDPRKTEAFDRGLGCFREGSRQLPTWFERLDVPFEGGSLPGYFCRASGSSSPTVVFIGGADTFAEQLLFMGASRIVERGMHCFTMTGPGQGEALRKGMNARPDFEKPVGAVLDFLQGRPGVDPGRMALMGVSLGGYYAARAASLEKRAAACVLFGACYSVIDDIYDFYPTLQPALRHIVGARNDTEARPALSAFTLEGTIEKMQCPLLVSHGAEDYVVAPAAAYKTFEQARCPKTLRMWTREEGGAAHCMVDNRAQAYAFMFDWLSERLMGGKLRRN